MLSRYSNLNVPYRNVACSLACCQLSDTRGVLLGKHGYITPAKDVIEVAQVFLDLLVFHSPIRPCGGEVLFYSES